MPTLYLLDEYAAAASRMLPSEPNAGLRRHMISRPCAYAAEATIIFGEFYYYAYAIFAIIVYFCRHSAVIEPPPRRDAAMPMLTIEERRLP